MVYPKNRHPHEIPPGLTRLISLDAIMTESPFALSRCYPSRHDIFCHIGKQYLPITAHTDSCARPKSSIQLRISPDLNDLRRLPSAPAGSWLFPTLPPQVLPQVPGPLSRWVPMVHLPVSSHRHRPSPSEQWIGFPTSFRAATSVRERFRDCNHSFMFRPPGLLATQVAPTSNDTTGSLNNDTRYNAI